MNELLYLGQWQVFFRYGPEYGDIVAGEEVEFRLFIEYFDKGIFSGRSIDWEGIGADGEVSSINGFIEDDLISFRKQYSEGFQIDEWGNNVTEAGSLGHLVTYEGRYDFSTNAFYGSWEISSDIGDIGEYWIQEFSTGTWRMSRI